MRDEPSATARFIAEHIVLLGSEDHALLEIPADQIEWTVRLLETCGWSRRALGRKSWRAISRLTERLSIPGVRTHYVLRKRIIEQEARKAISEGFRRIVVIAGGFDVLALRLAHEFPHVRFLELDHPATQRVKRETLERYGSPKNLALAAVDLRHESIPAGEEPTLFIAEGVLMYFSEEEVGKILHALGHRVVFTAMESIDGFRGSSRFVRRWLQWKGEPFRWAIARGDVAPFLRRHGLSLRRFYGSSEIRAQLPSRAAGRRIAEGEVIIVAE